MLKETQEQAMARRKQSYQRNLKNFRIQYQNDLQSKMQKFTSSPPLSSSDLKSPSESISNTMIARPSTKEAALRTMIKIENQEVNIQGHRVQAKPKNRTRTQMNLSCDFSKAPTSNADLKSQFRTNDSIMSNSHKRSMMKQKFDQVVRTGKPQTQPGTPNDKKKTVFIGYKQMAQLDDNTVSHDKQLMPANY